MGGMIVQEMVKISENRVKKLICFATGSIGDIPGRFEPMDTTRERLKKQGWHTRKRYIFLPHVLTRKNQKFRVS